MSKKIAMIFPGQGSQTIGMGKSFYENSEMAREMFDEAGKRIGVDFKELLFQDNEKINETAYTQPAILLVSMVAYRLFQEQCSVDAELFLGHSLGEFSAVCASGALNYIDAVELVHKRGSLMQDACDGIDAGMMALVGLDDETVENLCQEAQDAGKKVWAANYNQDGQLVVAGLKSDLSAMEQTFKDAGAKRAILLNMSVSSHCDLLSSAQLPLKVELEKMLSDSFSAPIISNVTAAPYQCKAEALELLVDQLVKPVRYKQSIAAVAPQLDLAIEFGNGVLLKGLNRRIAKELKTVNVSDMESLVKVVEELS
ncbi:MAG: ACP S-malonyltransferase [Campylobacterota bacterium]|nr:ACP S-malonyltransferase [Campylobacterota bacterium]